MQDLRVCPGWIRILEHRSDLLHHSPDCEKRDQLQPSEESGGGEPRGSGLQPPSTQLRTPGPALRGLLLGHWKACPAPREMGGTQPPAGTRGPQTAVRHRSADARRGHTTETPFLPVASAPGALLRVSRGHAACATWGLEAQAGPTQHGQAAGSRGIRWTGRERQGRPPAPRGAWGFAVTPRPAGWARPPPHPGPLLPPGRWPVSSPALPLQPGGLVLPALPGGGVRWSWLTAVRRACRGTRVCAVTSPVSPRHSPRTGRLGSGTCHCEATVHHGGGGASSSPRPSEPNPRWFHRTLLLPTVPSPGHPASAPSPQHPAQGTHSQHPASAPSP